MTAAEDGRSPGTAASLLFPVFFRSYFIKIIGCGIDLFGIVAGAFGVRVPVSWLMSRQPVVSLFHIVLATPASTAAQTVLCGIYFAMLSRRQKGLAIQQ